MIGNALRVDIERYASTFGLENPLGSAARGGRLGAGHIVAYLASIRFLLAHTPIHLKRACDESTRLGMVALSNHFRAKLEEEVGHEAWAVRDIQRVTSSMSDPGRPEVLPSMERMVRYIESLIDRNPMLYLSYILFAEHITVLVGPELLDALEERCGVPRSSMSAIGNHVELDREHVEEGIEAIDDLVGEPSMLVPMREAVARSIEIFESFCQEVAHGSRGSARPVPSVHVSAA